MGKEKQLPLNRIAFSLEEVATITGLSQRYLKAEHDRRRLEFVTVDGRDLILIRELRRYLAHRKEEPTQEEPTQMVLFESEDSEPKARKSRKT